MVELDSEEIDIPSSFETRGDWKKEAGLWRTDGYARQSDWTDKGERTVEICTSYDLCIEQLF
jgi:hypothetical protein